MNKKIKLTIAIFSSFIIAVFVIIFTSFKFFIPTTEVLYYSPVIDKSGNNVAYIKRSVNYYFKEIKIDLIPFMGAPPALRVMRDHIQLCKRNIDNNKETTLIEWRLPLEKKNKLGRVEAELDWHEKDLKYKITLMGYGNIGIGIRKNGPSGLEWILTNLKNGEAIVQGPSRTAEISVALTENPERIRFPTSNKIVIENR